MFPFRTSRLPLLVTCAALALSGAVSGSVAHAQPGDLDAMAYGDLQRSPKREATSTPRVIKADPQIRPTRAPVPAGGGGLLEALGLKLEPAASGPMDSNAQIAPAPPAAPALTPVVVPAPVVRVAPTPVVRVAPAPPPVVRVVPAMPVSYAAPALAAVDHDYRVDAGDKLRVVVFGQEGLTNTYAIDAGGGITMPLIGRVVARGMTPAGLAAHITAMLRKGYIREPSVAVEVEAYRPFFILGEVAAPGQYPYVPNMSVEAAVAIAGGFSPRARRDSVTLTHKADGAQLREAVPLGTSISPGDTIMVGERWF